MILPSAISFPTILPMKPDDPILRIFSPEIVNNCPIDLDKETLLILIQFRYENLRGASKLFPVLPSEFTETLINHVGVLRDVV